MEEKQPFHTSCVLLDAWIRDLGWGLKFDLNISVRNYFFTSEGAVLYFQQLSIARN